ncbi:MAG: 23S rRNA (guanosine(2251)-2'-O)-methyltransferase RlmB [Ectothiorhodospiraceae bacterium]|nr:23S rRNA (guanosine(2251)-2'-O)-methyltransferase RlmB [Chromatiales bacterium]MCP5157089.1 23S rRNA (guanosine(2251)-2'-O)-methyltransferase RlmB [Ectothiorhodospiraceae bacterium]
MAAELVHGRHAVEALVETDPAGILELWLLEGRDDPATRALASWAERQGVALHLATRRTLDRITGGARHQGFAARYRAVSARREATLDSLLDPTRGPALVLALDEVQDPRNLGACLRSAAAAGATGVVVPRRRSAPLSPVALKAAAGTAARLELCTVPNLARALGELGAAGLRIVGADAGAPRRLYDEPLTGPVVVVLGGEGAGLRRLTREACHALVSIPMAPGVESLNVSVAAALLLFEAARQRAAEAAAGA